MQKLKYYLAVPNNWSEAVQKLWRIKRATLAMNVSIVAIAVVMIAVFWFTAAILISELDNVATPVFLFLATLYFAGFILSLFIYILEWIFYINIKRWQGVAPEQLKDNIKRFSLYIIIALIATLVSYFLNKFTHTPYISIIANAILFPTFIAIVVAEIGKFLTISKMRKAEDMPTKARKGMLHLFYSYIIKYGAYIVGILFLFLAVIVASFDDDVDYENFGIYGEMYAHEVWIDDDEYLDIEDLQHIEPYYGYGWYIGNFSELFSHDMNEIDDILDGLLYCAKYDCEEMIDEITDNDAVTFLSSTGLIIIALGAIIAFFLHYRGWWLVSKSEFDTLPEHTLTADCEEAACEEVIESHAVVENNDTTTQSE